MLNQAVNPSTEPVGTISEPHPDNIELADLEPETATSNQTAAGPPIDGGIQAWRLLLAALSSSRFYRGFRYLLVSFKITTPR